jgi:hypothetical protein
MTAILRHRFLLAFSAALLIGCLGASSPALAARVGVDSAVNPEVVGTPPGGAPQRIVLGQDVLFNERIATTAVGQTQILFVDASSLTVGPNSNMVIDQFVYDPSAGTGKLAASLTRGVFRFVGGALSKGDNPVTFRTPTATIGIRGGVMLIDLNPNCGAGIATTGCDALQVVFAYGKGVTVTGLNGVSQAITRPGFRVTVAGPGAAPSTPAPAPRAAIGGFLTRLDGRAGAHGGAHTIPTDVVVEKSTAAVISSTAPTVETAQPPSVENTLQSMALINNIQNTQSGGALPNATPVVPVSPPPVSSVLPPPVGSVSPPPVGSVSPPPTINIPNVAGGFASTDSSGTASGLPGSPLAYAGGNVTNGQVTISGSFGQLSFPLVAGSSVLSATGAGTASPLGPVTGQAYLSPDKTFFFADLTPIADPSQREFVYGGLPVNQSFFHTASGTARVLTFAVQPDAALQALIPFIRQGTGGALAGASVSPLIFATPAGSTFLTGSGATKALQASLGIAGSGAGQQSVIVVLVGNVVPSAGRPSLTGVMHGSFLGNAGGQPIRLNAFYKTPADGNGNAFYGKNGISGFILSSGAGGGATEINTANQTTIGNYQFTQPAIATGGGPVTQSTRAIKGWFSGVMTREAIGGKGHPFSYALAGSTKIATNASDLQIAATLTGGDPFTSGKSGIDKTNGMVLQSGSLQPGVTQARQAFIDDSLFAALESPDSGTPSKVNGFPVLFTGSNPNLFFVTATAAPPTALLPNGLCACQFLQWGYWGGEIDTPAHGDTPARVDVGQLNSWVAGPLTQDISALKAMGATGTYSGNLFGSVDNNGAKYLASGLLNATYNFGMQQGSFSVINYDGRSFTLSGLAPLMGANYRIKINSNGLFGYVFGSFYGPGAIETGGNFAFRTMIGLPYFTSGIYGARLVGGSAGYR